MNLKNVSSEILLTNTETLVKNERRITTEILYHFSEIESRKAYATRYECKSLHEYATKVLKYSSGAASRRISAMYALRAKPELATKIEAGDLNVCSVSRVETFIRKEERITGERLSPEKKEELFQHAEALSQPALEKSLSRSLRRPLTGR